jgi:hypothetical protein
MTINEAFAILTVHQIWRKGGQVAMIQPKILTTAIDVILEYRLEQQKTTSEKYQNYKDWLNGKN